MSPSTAVLPIELWSHILSFCIEEPVNKGGHVFQNVLARALRVNSLIKTFFLAAAPHLYSNAYVLDPGTFLRGSDHPTAVFHDSFRSNEQVDLEYLRWGHRKLPLLRHLRQVTFHCPYFDWSEKAAVGPDSEGPIDPGESVADAVVILDQLLRASVFKSPPNFKILSIREPPANERRSSSPVIEFQRFSQLFIRVFRPTILCAGRVDDLITGEMLCLPDFAPPELVVIHAELDWMLTAAWGTKNRICLVDTKMSTEDDRSENMTTFEPQGGESGEQRETNGEGGTWEDYNENQTHVHPNGEDNEPADGRENTWEDPNENNIQTQTHHPVVRPASPPELFLGSFDPEDFDNDDNYDEWAEDGYDDFDDYDAYDGDLPSDEDGSDDQFASAPLYDSYSEDQVVFILSDFINRTWGNCDIKTMDGRLDAARKTMFEFYGLETYLSVEAMAELDPAWTEEVTDEVILERGIERIRLRVMEQVEDTMGQGEMPTISFYPEKVMPECEGCGRGRQK